MTAVARLERSLNGASAFITGAGSGMGRAMAVLFSREGAKVAVVDRNASAADAVVREIEEEGGTAVAVALDLLQLDRIAAAVEDIADRFGGLDVVVNNAGYAALTPIDAPDFRENWDQQITVLLTAQPLVIRAAMPFLRKSAHPRILNIASTEGLGATARQSAYSAAKAGVIGLTRSLAVELGREGMTVNCICPGPIETGITHDIPAEDKALYAKRRTALRRYGKPEEVAHIALSLCVPAASFITGAIIPVDGGLMARNA
ncbi:SDR family NAD(P)-dependent oxidoreductase [Sphingobium sp. HBC34]|uniref:SDR family NAD(P)-dependent oxidoreductase n=1 Tax=Sphingobium cyanobacteriorum TaxID=3063954 RepID=A0ABT8ZPM2_9SPHN|nr:SDR family NAD(P)-dependent oxidoreductase [Sphingobium sp. HBC34]MDO7836465.1 SDR family NAD(P)-dependent oxidoreductase [Sphingobium sp. HBC34]